MAPKLAKLLPKDVQYSQTIFLYHANYIFLGIDILQERMKKLCEENVIAKRASARPG